MNTAAAASASTEKPSSRFTSGPAIVLYIAAGKLLLHLVTAARYGIFRDEMYYLAWLAIWEEGASPRQSRR